MAKTVSRQEIDRLNVEDYTRKVRPNLKSGDLFFASGNYVGSRMIRHFTESEWSHVGVIIRLPSLDRVLLLESVETVGVRFAPLSKYLNSYRNDQPYDGAIVMARHNGVTDEVAGRLAKFGIDELTRPYDMDEVVRILGRIVFQQGRPQRNREYICSELVYECFDHAGLPFSYASKGYISPGEIWSDPKVVAGGRIL